MASAAITGDIGWRGLSECAISGIKLARQLLSVRPRFPCSKIQRSNDLLVMTVLTHFQLIGLPGMRGVQARLLSHGAGAVRCSAQRFPVYGCGGGNLTHGTLVDCGEVGVIFRWYCGGGVLSPFAVRSVPFRELRRCRSCPSPMA